MSAQYHGEEDNGEGKESGGAQHQNDKKFEPFVPTTSMSGFM